MKCLCEYDQDVPEKNLFCFETLLINKGLKQKDLKWPEHFTRAAS